MTYPRDSNHKLAGLKWKGKFLPGGLKDGKGVFTVLDTKEQFEAKFDEDKRVGDGKMVMKSGAYYQGSWKNGLFHGKGTYVYKQGKFYEGEFSEGFRHGKGILHDKDGVYDGKWV